jgi:hypothetical protein
MVWIGPAESWEKDPRSSEIDQDEEWGEQLLEDGRIAAFGIKWYDGKPGNPPGCHDEVEEADAEALRTIRTHVIDALETVPFPPIAFLARIERRNGMNSVLRADRLSGFRARTEFIPFGFDRTTCRQKIGILGTDQRLGVSFDQQDGSALGGWTGYGVIGAYNRTARHAVKCAEWCRTQDGAWRSSPRTGRAGFRLR